MKKRMLTGKPNEVIPCYPEYLPYNNELAKTTKYPGYYVTRSGKVISVRVRGRSGKIDLNRPRPHIAQIDKDGYERVGIACMYDGKPIKVFERVHRLVWEAWNGEIINDLTIDHIDCNPANNNLSNLRLMTREENASRANKGRPNPNRFKYRLYKNGKFLGVYDRKGLRKKIGITKNDFYGSTGRTRFCYKNGYKWIRESVEDIERVSAI